MECRTSDPNATAAGYWDARLRSPDCTEDDRALFTQWRDASAEHREAFERLQTIVATLRNNMGRADVRGLRDAALRAQAPATSRIRIRAVAGAIGSLLLATALWVTLPDRIRSDPVSGLTALLQTFSQSPQGQVFETGIGQRSTTTLSDGSSVDLDARTRIKVVFDHATRKVELVYGQALFHVAHSSSRPFIVSAADREITAVGTQFDVRLDARYVRVTLIEGKVKVSREPAPAAPEAAPRSQANTGASVLTPGEQFVARLPGTGPANKATAGSTTGNGGDESSPGDPLVHTVDVAKVTGWRDGRIFLEDLALGDAVAEMNRHSPVQIVVDDPEIAQLRINGMFHADEQEAFVAALKQYFPIAARREGDTEIILTLRR